MEDPFAPKNPVEIYLTREQIFRLAGLANDALVGMQIGSDCVDDTHCYVVMAHVEDSHENRHYTVSQDGALWDAT